MLDHSIRWALDTMAPRLPAFAGLPPEVFAEMREKARERIYQVAIGLTIEARELCAERGIPQPPNIKRLAIAELAEKEE